MNLYRLSLEESVRRALEEDLRDGGDLSSVLTVPVELAGIGTVVSKSDGVVAGMDCVAETFSQFDGSCELAPEVSDGDLVSKGSEILKVSGPVRSLLAAERTALNFLAHLSGIATITSEFVNAIKGTNAVIVDTRKTTPGLRLLEKAAVSAGNGVNHRMGLFDAVLLKDNHIVAAGGVKQAVSLAKDQTDLPVQVEVESLAELSEAIDSVADSVLLDNMSPVEVKRAVEIVKARAPHIATEASGGIDLGTVKGYALTGVDRISVGALTHSAKALDVSFSITMLES